MQLAERTAPRKPPCGLAQRRIERKLDLWRLRGQAARLARQQRLPPPLPRSTAPEQREAVIAAWLAGYDGR